METPFAFWTRSETEKLKKKRNELFINQLGKIKLFKLKKKGRKYPIKTDNISRPYIFGKIYYNYIY